MQFIDSHIHLQDYKEKNVQQIIKKMQSLGFTKIICASSHPSDWYKIAEITTDNSDFIIPAFGIHPWYIDKTNPTWQNELQDYLKQFSNALIGECGLDNLKAENKDLQETFFIDQIQIAKKHNRSICIHSLKADNQIEKLLPEMPDKFMLHAFNGSIETLQKILKFGGYISISDTIFKKKNHIDIIKQIPLDRLLSESDGPYMSDFEKINDLITHIAKIKNIDKIALIEQIYYNFKEFCRV